MMVKIMQRIYLRPLFNKLRQHLDISLPLIVKSGLFEDDEHVTARHKIEKGKARWVTKKVEIEIILKEDLIEICVRAKYSLGEDCSYRKLIFEKLHRKIGIYSDGNLHTIYLIDAKRAAFSFKNILEIKCEEITRRFVELNTVLKETAVERRAIYDAFLEIDAHLVKPFIEKVDPGFIPK